MFNAIPKLRKSYILSLFALISFVSLVNLNGQYTFSALSGTYTPLTGGTVVSAIQTDDATSGSINLGFSFRYNGKNYSQIKVSSNGFISFRITTLSSSYAYLYSDSLVVAILSGDLSGSGGTASYKTEGSAPNRIFTMEWLNWKWNYTATQPGISMQVKFYETSNRIEYIYRQESGSLVNPNALIGLSFQKNGSYMNLTNSSSSPSITTDSYTYITQKPSTGQIYRFDEVISPKSDNHATNFSPIAPNSINVQWTDAVGTNLPSRYLIKASNVSLAAITNPVDGTEIIPDLDLKDGTGAVYVDYGVQNFKGWTDSIGNTTMYMKIFPVSNFYSNTRYKTDGTVPQLQINVPFYQARILTFSNINSTSMTLNWVRGSGTNCVVFAKENGTGLASPNNNTTYTGNAACGTGTQIGTTGWYCIYNGNSNSVTVTGLKLLTNYAFHVIEYTGIAGAEQYSLIDEPTGHVVQSSNMFTEQTGISFANLAYSASAWGDYNNDGFLDVMINGWDGSTYLSKLYKNNGNNTFTEQTGISLTGVDNSQISWGDYDNDGNLDILFEGITSGSVPVTKIYHNNGNNTFTEQTSINLTRLYLGSAVWGDYDNDGYLDILLTGYDGSRAISKIYRNNHNNSFVEQTDISLVGVHQGKSTWFDYDNDGRLDIILTGYTKSSYVTKIYHNNGNNTFTEQTSANLIGVYYSDVATGDYDNDGYPDILISGNTGNSNVSKIYHNDGDGTFTELTSAALTGVYNSSVSWVDVDNDGLLDVFISGLTGVSRISKVYKNNGNGTFTEQTAYSLPGIDLGSATWVDYDNDGDLDAFLLGNGPTGRIAKILKNDNTVANTSPQAPTGLSSNINGELMVLNWNRVKTDATPYKSMSYNLRIGKTSGASDVMACHSSSTGFRRIVGYGNTQLDTFHTIRNLKKGTYFWSVQAVDNSYAGGAFGAEQTFVYNVDIQSKALKTINTKSTSLKLQWNRGNGDKCLVFMKENGTDNALPVNNSTYTANPFGSGTQIGTTGWYCVFNGTLDTTTVINLKANTPYRIEVIEYTGIAGAEIYNTNFTTDNLISQLTGQFTELTSTIAAVTNCNVAWGDYNNDGYLDAFIIGNNTSYNNTAKLYKNNGNSTFTEQTSITFTGVSQGASAWGDYDNDGYLDILYCGSSSSYVTKLYHNNGNNTFTEQTGLSLPGVYQSACSWGDFDNNGYLDILLMGNTGSGYIAKIFRNNGNATFTEQTTSILTGYYQGTAKCFDYNNDGYLDIILTGRSQFGYSTKIFRNNGDYTFSEQTSINLPSAYYSDLAIGDYDNDGFPDLLLSGGYNGSYISKVIRNNGDNTFSEQTSILLPGVNNCSVSWADVDNDGDFDIFISGTNGTYLSKIYINNGDNTFTEQTNTSFPGVAACSSTWADIDNDGDLDLLTTGTSATGMIAKVYRNEINVVNTVAQAPTGLVSNISGNNVILHWNPVKTDATPYKALSYNVRIGKISGASDIVACQSSSAGFRRIVGYGNAQQDTSYIIKNLKKGTYYWSVQAVDNTYAGGTFGAEQSFVYNVNIQSGNILINPVSSSSVKLKWIRGNGDKCVVFAAENGTGTAVPAVNTTYTGDKAFGTGTQVGTTGWYCLYNGNLDTATITSLKSNTMYKFQVIEYSGTAGAENYYTTAGINNPALYTPSFQEQTQISLQGINGRVEAWGDYNNDGYLDLFVAGNDGSSTVTKLFKNNGDNTFSEVTTALFSISTAYDATWCDFDNDGDMDILIAGLPNSKLYANNGDGTFTLKTTLPSLFTGKSTWADLDNDGFKDLILTGSSETDILKNNHDGTFTTQTFTLPGVSNYSSVACGDYDNDGDLDILIAGYNSDASDDITKVFRNDGSFTFTEQTGIVLTGVSNCAVTWADMDNDGDLDIVLSGGGTDIYTKIYDNNGNNTFTELTNTPLKGLYRSALAVADYDNDGYNDVIVSGSIDGTDCYTVVYHNNGNKTYTQSTNVTFPGVQFGSAAWGDFDNDGDLDLFLCGNTTSGKIAKIYKNNCTTINAKPNTINSLGINLDVSDVTFTWYKPYDDKTLSSGLSYNLYVYETSKTGFIKSSEALNVSNTLNGSRLVAKIGDIQYSSSGYTLKGLPAGNYKCSIQAIDASLLGGAFRNESSFSIVDLSSVGINIVNSQITNTNYNMQYSISSTDGTNGTWTYCNNNNTTIYDTNFGNGGFDVWVRQGGNNTNKRKIATVAAKADAPAYTINYLASATAENIPATVEYSVNSNMTGVVSVGTGNPVALTPGTNLYFRVKATSTTVASTIRSLIVPAAPATPTFTIDFNQETTGQTVSSVYEYSTTSDMSNSNTGSGNQITIVPGQSLYFRVKATSTSFKSIIQILVSPNRPAAPAFTLDYINETIAQNVSSSYEYSTNSDMSGATVGVGNKAPIIPGQTMYFRGNASASGFKSNVQTLVVPSRPASPSNLVINDLNNTFEWTNESSYPLLGQYEYSINNGSTWTTVVSKPTNVGNVNIAAGALQIRVKSSSTNFSGDILGSSSAFTINTSIPNLSDIGIKMYPNPVLSELIIDGLKEQTTVTISDIHGKIVISAELLNKTERVNVSDLPSGMYILTIENSADKGQAKFIKQ